MRGLKAAAVPSGTAVAAALRADGGNHEHRESADHPWH